MKPNRLKGLREHTTPETPMTDPTPGSDAAREQGCKCPVMDNARGRGARGTSGPSAIFYINGDCPIHGLGGTDDD